MRRRAAICGLLLALVAVAATAASGASAARTKQKTIYFVTYTMTIPYFQQMALGLKAEARKLGFKLKVSAANFDAAQEANLVQTAVTQKADAIVLAPIDRSALIPAASKATAAGIPVVLVGDDFSAAGQKQMLTYVGVPESYYGVMKAKFIDSRLPGHKGTVVVIHGPRGLDYVEGQKAGYSGFFSKKPGISVVEGPYGNFSSEVGLSSLQNVLTRTPDPKAVYFDNDDLALGGLQALKAANKSGVITIGSDGAPAAIAAVRNGTMTATVATRPYATGQKSLDVLNAYFATHKAPPKIVRVLPALITKQTLKKLKPSDYR
jgi:ABC-type sugar transport system substrate-binding protein